MHIPSECYVSKDSFFTVLTLHHFLSVPSEKSALKSVSNWEENEDQISYM